MAENSVLWDGLSTNNLRRQAAIGGPSKTQAYDAIVVGTGFGGSTLAYRLAKRDLRVLVLERGDFLRLPPWRAGDPIGIHIRSAPAQTS